MISAQGWKFYVAIFSLLGLAFFPQKANAAIVTWDGGGGVDTNWSTGINWSTNSPPTTADVATFDNTSDNDAIINSAIDVLGIDVNAGLTSAYHLHLFALGLLKMKKGKSENLCTHCSNRYFHGFCTDFSFGALRPF